jgi:hypothetical protein
VLKQAIFAPLEREVAVDHWRSRGASNYPINAHKLFLRPAIQGNLLNTAIKHSDNSSDWKLPLRKFRASNGADNVEMLHL